MKNINDYEYISLVSDILDNKDFNKLSTIEHHGTNRLDHSIKVSYYSYLVAKKLNLKYKEVARAGLLHDFFMSYEDRTSFERFISTFTHPKYAWINASKLFDLNDREKNIIRTHMFPINLAIPRYLESWLVSIVDKGVAFYEFYHSYSPIFRTAINYLYFFILFSLYRAD